MPGTNFYDKSLFIIYENYETSEGALFKAKSFWFSEVLLHAGTLTLPKQLRFLNF